MVRPIHYNPTQRREVCYPTATGGIVGLGAEAGLAELLNLLIPTLPTRIT